MSAATPTLPLAANGQIPTVSMTTVTVQGLRRSRSRFILTAIAVILSVAFFTSVMQLTSSLRGTAKSDIASATKGIDAVVRGAKIGKPRNAGPVSVDVRAELTSADVNAVADLTGIAATVAIVSVNANVVKSDGQIVDTGALGTRAEIWVVDSTLNTHRLVRGKAPVGRDQVVIERTIAEKANVDVGDQIRIATDAATITARVSGIADYATAKGSPLNGTVFFADGEAASLLETSSYDRIVVRSSKPDSLVSELKGALSNSKTTEVVAGAEFTADQQNEATSRTSFQTTFLSFFALVALLAGTTIIFNTFVISVQQRTKEIAMLRAIGTSKQQVLKSVLGEAALVGVFASGIGVGVGLLLFRLMIKVFEAIGLSFLSTDASVSLSSLIGPFLIGIVVTVASAALPARKAAGVAPMEALRDQAVDNSSIAQTRTIATAVIFVGALLFGVMGAVSSSGSMWALATGLGFVGVIVGGPVLVRGSTATIGRLLSRFGGQTGNIARTNLSRNPKRNASTSFSLSLGIALIVLFTSVAASLSDGVASDVKAGLRADHVVTTSATGPGALASIPRSTIEAISKVSGVKTVSALSSATLIINGEGTSAAVIDPKSFSKLYDLKTTGAPLRDLATNEIAVQRSTNRRVGDTVKVSFADRPAADMKVVTVFGRSLPGSPDSPRYLLNASAVEKAAVTAVYLQTDSKSKTLGAIDDTVQGAGAMRLRDKDGYLDSLASSADTFRNFVYALLAIALLISLVGIANTTMLSINERRREIGVMRAIGTTGRQVRRIVRLEALLLSIHGSVIGTVLGLAGATAAFSLLASDQGFSLTIPWSSLLIIALAGSCAGVVAAAWPAWRASKMDPLAAIASD
jgi:putative ABC transport system permease protein